MQGLIRIAIIVSMKRTLMLIVDRQTDEWMNEQTGG